MYRLDVLPWYLSVVNCCAHQSRTTGLVTSRYDDEPGQHQLRTQCGTSAATTRPGHCQGEPGKHLVRSSRLLTVSAATAPPLSAQQG
jgi:hypothetical protein